VGGQQLFVPFVHKKGCLIVIIERLYERGGVLAVAKPAGLPTQAPAGIESVETLLRQQLFGEAFQAAVAAGQHRHPGGFLGVPHRLDRPVSGVLLLAGTPRAARQLSRQFERRQIEKVYLALVTADSAAGLAQGDTFTWQDSLRKVPDEPRAEVAPDEPAAQVAITTGRVLAGMADRLLLELRPQTGRMHQLRVQAAARGLPIVGDRLYGCEDRQPVERTSPIGLHASAITFCDPDKAVPVTVNCPLPPTADWLPWQEIVAMPPG
jgi:23S rRNA pseudouridine1911/1915/1917 synthase